MRCWRRPASEAAPFMASTANDAASGGILLFFHAIGAGTRSVAMTVWVENRVDSALARRYYA